MARCLKAQRAPNQEQQRNGKCGTADHVHIAIGLKGNQKERHEFEF